MQVGGRRNQIKKNEIELEVVQQYVSVVEYAERGLELGGQYLSAKLTVAKQYTTLHSTSNLV